MQCKYVRSSYIERSLSVSNKKGITDFCTETFQIWLNLCVCVFFFWQFLFWLFENTFDFLFALVRVFGPLIHVGCIRTYECAFAVKMHLCEMEIQFHRTLGSWAVKEDKRRGKKQLKNGFGERFEDFYHTKYISMPNAIEFLCLFCTTCSINPLSRGM